MSVCKPIYDAEIASSYDNDRENEEHWVKENDFIYDYFRDMNVSQILDVPIGTGRFIKFYPESAKILGVDVSADMLSQASKAIERSGRIGVDLRIGDAANLYFVEDKSVDVIVCIRLLHLVENSDRLMFLGEFSRILKGDLIIQVYLDLSKKNIFYRALFLIKRILKKITDNLFNSIEPKKPWSHIKSYGLSELEFHSILFKTGLIVVKKTRLCKYCGLDVVMYVLRNE